MPKPHTFPVLLDEVKTVSISKLKEWQYLEPTSIKSGTITWSRAGEQVGSINVFCRMREEPYIWLTYRFNDEPVEYKIKLISIPSNLGKGNIWYFVCPHTGKKCRKLYGAGKYFLHRDAYPQAMYESQTYSKRGRTVNKVCKIMYGSDELYDELYSKHFKTHYAGKPTKRYKQIMNELEYIRQNQDQAMNTFMSELYR